MAVCNSLQHIFEKQLPENQTLVDQSVSSSWSQNVVNPVEQTTQGSSFSELFGELYSKDGSASPLPSPSPSPSLPIPYYQSSLPFIDSSQMSTNKNESEQNQKKDLFPLSFPLDNKIDTGFSSSSSSSMKSESLQLCTEGLGSESSDDVEDHLQVDEMMMNEKQDQVKHVEVRRSRMSRQAFPPPLSFIGRSGKTGICFKSYRQDGRFVLKEVRIPTQEFLQARREHGRLKLQIVQPSDYILEDEDEDEEHDDDVQENDVRNNG